MANWRPTLTDEEQLLITMALGYVREAKVLDIEMDELAVILKKRFAKKAAIDRFMEERKNQ